MISRRLYFVNAHACQSKAFVIFNGSCCIPHFFFVIPLPFNIHCHTPSCAFKSPGFLTNRMSLFKRQEVVRSRGFRNCVLKALQ